MNWKNVRPGAGQKRIIYTFLLLPKCIDNDCRWLQFVGIEQEYYYIYAEFWSQEGWRDVRWVK